MVTMVAIETIEVTITTETIEVMVTIEKIEKNRKIGE
jgi:hypothetical protein